MYFTNIAYASGGVRIRKVRGGALSAGIREKGLKLVKGITLRAWEWSWSTSTLK